MRRAGYNPTSLAVAASLGGTAVRDIIDGRIASPRYATIQALARVLDVSPTVLAEGGDISHGRAAGGVSTSARSSDLPVYSAAEGGTAGSMVVSSDPIQWVHRPEPLLTVSAGYGVFVVGESMVPAYDQGDVALVHPSAPPRRGSDVILFRQEADGTRHVLLKRLIGWTEKTWRVRQYNPAKEFNLTRTIWQDVHTVVGRYNAR